MQERRLQGRTILYLVTEDWYFWSHRLPIARAARDAGARVVVATRMDAHAERIAAEGFIPCAIPFDRSGLNPINDTATVSAIIRAYKFYRPDLVHHVAAKPVLYGSLAATIAGVPHVINAMAGLGFLFIGENAKARLLRRAFETGLRDLVHRANSWMIVQNGDDHAVLERLGFSHNRLVLIPGSGVDLDAFPVVEELQTVPPRAVCVSRMLWDKGIGELVEAARILRARGIELTVRLVGSTDLNPAGIPASTLQAWANEGIVEVAGHTSDVAGEYARASFAVLPSYREGLPKSLLEAASCGRAMVATDVPGCRDICRDEETGLLVPHKNSDALAEALARLAGDPELRGRLGARARAIVESEFAQSIIVEKTLALYRAALSQHR